MKVHTLAVGVAAFACASNALSDGQFAKLHKARDYLAPRQSVSSSNSSSNGGLAYSPPYYPSPWIDGSGDWAAAQTKAKAFVAQLTLLEKVNLTTGVGWEGEACVGNVGSIPRLGFASICLQDSPVGVRLSDYNSVFPAGGTVAAAWDRQIWYDRGFAMGEEFAGKGIDVALGPVVGPLGRAPEGGRNWEGFSPDPYLSGIAVAESVKGIQKAGVVATTKHYILNEQEHFRQVGESKNWGFNITETLSSNVDDVTMHELYLWPFADAVRAGTGAVMCSYQQINNSYGCANSHTINYLLKGELGFQGFLMSDWQAQHSGVASAYAGLDMSMPGDTEFDSSATYWGANLTIAVVNGTMPEWRLDDMVTRIMSAYYYVGRDTKKIPTNFNSWSRDEYGYQHAVAKEGYSKINSRVDVRKNHGDLIREHAAKSTVLLKNVNRALPLTGKEKFTGIFGADAGDSPIGPNGADNRGADNGTLATGWGSGTAEFPYLVSPQTAIQNTLLENNAQVAAVTDGWATSVIKTLASQVSHALVFVDADAGEGFIAIDGNIGDRNNLTLWRNGDNVTETVASVCNNTILVIHGVGPVLIEKYANHPNVTAILWAGLPGEQSGNAIADILYGRDTPGGKLPFTFGAKREDFGTDVLYEPNNGQDAPQQDYTEGILIDYRYFDAKNITPTYEFGFGLSYTTFEYSNIKVTAEDAAPYQPTQGNTAAATTYRNSSKNLADYQFPSGFHEIPYYIYPFVNGTDAKAASRDADYGSPHDWPQGATDSSPQPKLRASGAPGGNPGLYEVLYTVTATIKNTGSVAGDEVAQLYVSLGGPNDAPKVLRGFERITIKPGATATFTADLTRRDVSNWNTVIQDWEVTSNPKTVYVGSSSRKLPLQAGLPLSQPKGY